MKIHKIDAAPAKDDEGGYAGEFLASLLRGIADIKHGRTYPLESVKRILGI